MKGRSAFLTKANARSKDQEWVRQPTILILELVPGPKLAQVMAPSTPAVKA